MLKVGIVGCGKIADSHALQIQRVAGCKIVAACDREMLMARQFAERFSVEQCFTEVEDLIKVAHPDVVHITTPPASHFALAKRCLENGFHVYVEKPFALVADEAQGLIDLATKRGTKLTVGHNYQFNPAARRMRALIKDGYLGGTPVHMESYYGYDLGDPSYARALLGDKQHWVRKLPGKLLQNIISHGVARIAEYLTGDDPSVIASGMPSYVLKGLGEEEIIDELRVMIRDGQGTTAYFTFSSQMKPVLHEFRIYGPKNGLILDQNHEVLVRLRGTKFKSYADFFIPPLISAKQQMSNWLGNISLFMRRDFHMDAGMKYLIEAFYRSIVDDDPVPIPYREILLTTRIMDKIFSQVQMSELERHAVAMRE
jgi:predicted dehydrogenase